MSKLGECFQGERIKLKQIDTGRYGDCFTLVHGDEGKGELADKHKAAVETALDIRKFEIEMYWKRASYFWLFMAAAFSGYWIAEGNGGNIRYSLCLLLASVGIVVALAFFFANKGSKFWQQNWEHHVDLLENQYMGPLYKTICVSEGYHFWHPTKEYPFSVSKLNQMLTSFLCVIWWLLWIRAIYLYGTEYLGCTNFGWTSGDELWFFLLIVTTLAFLIGLCTSCGASALLHPAHTVAPQEGGRERLIFERNEETSAQDGPTQ